MLEHNICIGGMCVQPSHTGIESQLMINNRYHNITITDVSEAVGHQKKNKSAGPNGLYMESYIYAGDKLNVHLSLL